MKSATLPSFWAEYRQLNNHVREGARKAYRLWAENPFHPSILNVSTARKEFGQSVLPGVIVLLEFKKATR